MFKCRSCGEADTQVVLSLGHLPLANRLLTRSQLSEPEPVYPLELVFCPHCSLVQINVTIPPDTLFREYLYFSSFASTTLESARKIAERMIQNRGLTENSQVVEIASNDGYLLQFYQRAGIRVLGIEPAINIAKVATEERGIRTLSEFFSLELAKELHNGGVQADVIHANNVLAHVADLNDFVDGIATLIKEDGIIVIEVPYLKETISRVEFDTIYHEHLCYFSLISLDTLFRRHGLIITDAENLSIHGGSLRIFACKNIRKLAPSPIVGSMMADEVELGMNDISFYRDFSAKVEHLRTDLQSVLKSLKNQNKHIAAYGASAKGSTLLNYFGIGHEHIDFIVDRSPVKQGLYTPGTHLPIYAPEKLLEAMPEYVLLLTWNFADEILLQQAEYRDRGGKFILPLPEPLII